MKFGKMLGYISPAYGMMSGHGPFAHGGMLGMLGGMAGAFGGHPGADRGGEPGHQGMAPAAMPQVAPQAMPGAMGQVSGPMQPIQQGQPQAPTNFGQPGGMFGGGADPRQAMMQKYRQWQMLNQGGGY